MRSFFEWLINSFCFIQSIVHINQVGDDSPMFSVDCEMCRTTAGRNELTRISVVNERLEQVYHSLVMPPNPIIDFLTRYSGITKDMLEGVTTTLEDVQAELRRILPPNCILVGQASKQRLNQRDVFYSSSI